MAEVHDRKDEHIAINTQKDVLSGLTNGFERYAFVHQALPEIALSDVKTQCEFLGHKLALPLLISSMTGGTHKGIQINLILAEAAQTCGVAMGIGSQRADLEGDAQAATSTLRSIAPHVPLFANLGAVQLNYGYGLSECRRAVDLIQADGLIFHLNPLQEALQPEGQTNFAGLADKIGKICQDIGVPVIVKEVGWGISIETARRLVDVGVAAIDVAGAGGTSWSEVEKYRSIDERRFQVASRFLNWGIPTADALQRIHHELTGLPLIASGGMYNGIDIAKSIALGASIAGIARPLLIAAQKSVEEVISAINQIRLEMAITMFAAGARNLSALSRVKLQSI